MYLKNELREGSYEKVKGAILLKQNGRAHIRHKCRETAVFNCHRFMINSGVEKMNNI